jgi:hypothetical protein
MSTLTKVENEITEALIINGDLSKLKPEHKVLYYKQYCERLGLDPFTQPFKILKLSGKEVLYCDRSGTQQLNKLHNVSHEVRNRELLKEVDVYQVTARAILPDGRYTDSIGAVNVASLKGEAYANAIMKAETKAKRRSTLDLLGLGILDETEAETIPGAQTISVYKGEEPDHDKPKVTDGQLALIEGLIHNCTLTENQLIKIEGEMFDYTQERAEKCITFLRENQKPTLEQDFTRALEKEN